MTVETKINNTDQSCACLSIIMPVYNEAATLAAIVKAVNKVAHLKELIIVDDCSTDGTDAIAQKLADKHSHIKYIRHQKNGGKTDALITGFAASTGEIVIVQDADMEYDPDEIADVISPILNGHADVVYGSRFMVKKAARILYYGHYLANKALTFFSNCLTNLNMSDIETCYKAFRGDIIRNMTVTSKGFGFEVEVTAKIAKLNCSIYEVPISYYGRTYEEGKKIGTKDGIAALYYIFKYNLLTRFGSSFRNPETVLSARTRHLLPAASDD